MDFMTKAISFQLLKNFTIAHLQNYLKIEVMLILYNFDSDKKRIFAASF
ncbi:hypothetical protein FLAVO9AF_220030 [Flavobacterium sp. 9AF]|nr:hypothetical protein FLAVO9AF_220030 [Flavobacterium sp. 9AF]